MKQESPLVSIITPTYNRAKYIKRAIESALRQTYQNIEIIIIDDGSTDNTKEALSPYLKDKRIYYLYQENQGVSKARNKAIKISKGKYIALLDSDDFWQNPKKLEKQTKFLEEHSDYVLTSGGMIRINKTGKEISKFFNPETDKKIRKGMLSSCLISPSAAVFPRRAWELVGGFDENCSDLSEDWDLWLKFGRLGKFYNFQEYFLYYLQGEQNRSNFNRRPNLKYNIGLIKKYRNDYPGYRKALFLQWAYYLYSFLPLREKLLPVFSKIKRIIFGKPAYKSFKL